MYDGDLVVSSLALLEVDRHDVPVNVGGAMCRVWAEQARFKRHAAHRICFMGKSYNRKYNLTVKRYRKWEISLKTQYGGSAVFLYIKHVYQHVYTELAISEICAVSKFERRKFQAVAKSGGCYRSRRPKW